MGDSGRITANSDTMKNNFGCFASLNMTVRWGVCLGADE